MKKVLFLNTNIGYGGASKIMVWVANSLAGNNYNVTFVTYRDDDIQQPLSPKVNFVYLPLESHESGKTNALRTSYKLRKFIKDNDFDFAIGFLSPSQLRLSLACIGLKTKLIFSERGDPYQIKIKSIKSLLSLWAFRRANFFVFQTKGAQSYYSKRIQQSSCIIPNPIIPLKRSCNRAGKIEARIVNVARLDIKQKRQDLLISAFKQISSKHPEYVLELYGDGPDLENLKEMADRHPMIRFMGKTTDVVSAIQNATCSVLSSDFEGVPNSLLEAMSLGVPSISTDCSPGGAAMLINNGYNGLLIPRNDVEALSEAISYIISNRPKSELMGKMAQEINNLYSEQKIASKWIELLNNFPG